MTVELVPRKLTLVCRLVAVLVVVAFGVISALLPGVSEDGTVFGPADQIAFFAIGVLLAVAVLAFTRVRVRADVQGLWVRNVLGERYFPWGVVAGVELRDGAPWAQLVLQDDDTVALLAVQSNDGNAAVDAVLALRRLLRDSGTGDGARTL
ncbi:MAG: hypothetical protein JWO12_1013 [Frankiales bacterium]|nr:hypothetical protein [Frankiales bacterium]